MQIDISKFDHCRLLVVGDLMIDEYVWGEVDRISPEAPVQVVSVKNEEYTLGGSGNVVNNLVALGAKVSVLGVSGTGRDGKLLLNRLNDLGVDTRGVIPERSRPTTKKTRIIADHQQVLRIDRETKKEVAFSTFKSLTTLAEKIIPAADLSEQISTAGKEASGTGNMKFMMNGAVTIGTLDGANVEILEAVGEENFFLFGLNVDEIPALRENYDPQHIIDIDEDFTRVMRLLDNGHFNRFEPNVLDDVLNAVRNPKDPWMTAADFRAFIDAQELAGLAYQDQQHWTRMSILNSAASGRFSTDRTMRDYNEDIWHLEAIPTSTP